MCLYPGDDQGIPVQPANMLSKYIGSKTVKLYFGDRLDPYQFLTYFRERRSKLLLLCKHNRNSNDVRKPDELGNVFKDHLFFRNDRNKPLLHINYHKERIVFAEQGVFR
jgi:hypothetical protein